MKTKIIILVCVLLLLTSGCGQKEEALEKEEGNLVYIDESIPYEELLFDSSYVHVINIEISDEDWTDLKDNPTDKTKYHVDITIDNEKIEDVSFATKGNTSLSSVASNSDSNRYSFKVNFSKYNKKQTYHGLNKLNLNNIYADATYMKDYMSYQILNKVGVDSPLCSYVQLKVNGEDFGLYLAIEEIGESWLDRTEKEGNLYKPESEMLDNMGQIDVNKGDDFINNIPNIDGQGNFPNMNDIQGTFPNMDGDNKSFPDMKTGDNMPSMPFGGNMPDGFSPNQGDMPNGNFDFSNIEKDFKDMGNMPSMNFGGSNSGASLKYIDDNLESYSDIFNNNETDVTEEDEQRVIEALKALSENRDLEEYLDTDEIIRYFVGHNFVNNYDSYTGSLLHNYYLYEEDGKLSMYPWDYNLAFGAFGSSDGTSNINNGIDSPLQGGNDEDRPMWSWMVNNEEYLQKYHEIYDELLVSYFESGEFEKEIDAIYEMIRPYVEKDESSFYSLDEFDEAYKNLKEYCLKRAESIRKQLNGELSTITSEQKEEDKVDGSHIDIRAMGSHNNRDDKNEMDMRLSINQG